MPLPTWPVASGSLVLGFAVAQATGVRALGGLVLLAAVTWCLVRWRALAGLPAAVALGLLATGGALLGVVVANSVPERALEIGFAALLIYVSVELARDALRTPAADVP